MAEICKHLCIDILIGLCQHKIYEYKLDKVDMHLFVHFIYWFIVGTFVSVCLATLYLSSANK